MEDLDRGGVRTGRKRWTKGLNRLEELDGEGVKIGWRSWTEEELK